MHGFSYLDGITTLIDGSKTAVHFQ